MISEKSTSNNLFLFQSDEHGNYFFTTTYSHPLPVQNGIAITLSPEPIKLVVDTSTDWPMVISTAGVGLGSALIALAVGILSSRSQKRQVQSATANIRKEWQGQLRDAISKLVGTVTYISEELDADEGFRQTAESKEAYREMVEAQALIHLLLDRKKDSTGRIVALTRDLVNETWDNDRSRVSEFMQKLISESIDVLEQAWKDIRNDLNGTTEKY